MYVEPATNHLTRILLLLSWESICCFPKEGLGLLLALMSYQELLYGTRIVAPVTRSLRALSSSSRVDSTRSSIPCSNP